MRIKHCKHIMIEVYRYNADAIFIEKFAKILCYKRELMYHSS